MESRRFDDIARSFATGTSRRRLLGVVGSGLLAVADGTRRVDAQPERVALCHATGDPTNPYTAIEVPEPAAQTHLAHGDTPYVNCCLDTDCPEGETCGGMGIPGECGGCPTLTTCAAQGVECGFIPDGCGGPALDCGGCGVGDLCTGPETCTAGQCQPGAPIPCPPPADSCYVAATCDPGSGCGQPTYRGDGVSCGTGVCYQNACCTPYTCANHPAGCGQDLDNGCGGTIDCGIPVPGGGCATPCGNGLICQSICGAEAEGTCMSLGGDGLGQICRKPTGGTCAAYGTAGCGGPGSVCHWDNPTPPYHCYEVCYVS